MSELPASQPAALSAEAAATLFVQLVMQQTNMALMLLGKLANPAGDTMHDPEAAQFFMDQLAMLEVKTAGNLSPDEAALLKQNLAVVRKAYGEAGNTPKPEADSGKRFSKKY